MALEEVDRGPRPDPIPNIVKLCLIDHGVFIAMVTLEVGIGIILANFLHITMVDYKFTTQGFLKNLLQGF